MSASNTRQRAVPIATFVFGLALGAGLTLWLTRQGSVFRAEEPSPGQEIFGVVDEEVLSLTYSTERLTFTAQRSRPNDRFAVQLTYADGKAAQQCLASPALEGHLPALTKLVVKRVVPMDQVAAQHPIRLGTLQLKDSVVSEPISAMEFRSAPDGRWAAVSYGGSFFETTIPVATLAALESVCKAPAQH